jgi:hypothetical protein
MMLMESLDATKLMPEQRHHAAMPAHPRIAADSGSIDAIDPKVRIGSCVTSIAGPNGDAQLYER